MTAITREQYDFLLLPLAPSRVGQLKGQSHVEAWDVRRHLTRIFGFGGWDDEIIECSLVHENGAEKNGRIGWTVVYRVLLRLIIKDPDGNVIAHYEDAATGDAVNQPSIGDAHDFALKTAMSQALKRCAVNLGDQFGLSLYNKGQVGAVVGRSLVVPGETVAAQDLAEAAAKDAPVEPEARVPEPGTESERAESSAPEGATAAPSGAARMVAEAQHKRMHALWRDLGFDGDQNRDLRLQITSKFIGRGITSSKQLTAAEADIVIGRQEARKQELRANGAARAEQTGAAA